MRRKEKKRGRREMAEGNGDGKLRKGGTGIWVLGGDDMQGTALRNKESKDAMWAGAQRTKGRGRDEKEGRESIKND